MSRLYPDDLCWLRIPSGHRFVEYDGCECVVVSGLHMHEFPDGAKPAYQIEVVGFDGEAWACRSGLIKQPPPSTRLANWRECPFIPEGVSA